jgi:type I restriction enzyme R subunit
MDKRALSERDICTKFIMPALRTAGWDEMLQIREEYYFTRGRIIVRGKLVSRGKAKKADFVLYYKPNIPGQSGEAAEASSFPRKRESRCAAHSAEYSGMPPLPHGFPLSRE